MSLTIAVIAPGAMGSAVARRLADHGARVLTKLDGRSEATRKRAAAAGMAGADDAQIAAADVILSIVPPGEAEALAVQLRGAIAAAARKPVYIDCNAVNVETARRIEAVIAATGAPFVDAGIIGGPPRAGVEGPTFYLSGEAAPKAAVLADFGLKIRVLDAPNGAASALKMSYAGVTKGLTAIGAAMILGAARAGAAEALHAELAESQPQLLERFERALPDMFPKAYRWVAEMEEIAGFLGEEDGASLIYQGAAKVYARLAGDVAGDKRDIAVLESFLKA
ncbi:MULTISPECIES: NAD(P)-dependent oxidoreductase [Rhodomicrobium]|uniref:NAD(P)-dependent oxidoreductase n=1 Tax=Rhodomicrobium TaxID=1068 RepID=UPI000B4BEAA3|nr:MULTISPECIES: NAD(P)-dependent oxidoreductase [Rhodomicrobium]